MQLKIIVEKHPDGYVAYPVGLHAIIIGEGDTYEKALADLRSSGKFHIETFGMQDIEQQTTILDVFIAETGINMN